MIQSLAESFGHLASINDTYTVKGPFSRLHSIVVNKAVASSVVTVYNGAATTDPVFAVIDAAGSTRTFDFKGVRLPAGLFVKLTGGAADVTVTSS